VALVHLDKIEVPAVFKVIKDIGGVPEEDMINKPQYRRSVLTMVTAPAQETAMIKYLERKGIHCLSHREIISDDENTGSFPPASSAGGSRDPLYSLDY